MNERSSDCHIHTKASDGYASLEQIEDIVACLDFASPVDHNSLAIWPEWHAMIRERNKGRIEEEKTYTLPGVEISLEEQGEPVHMLAYFSPHITYPESRNPKVLETAVDEMEKRMQLLQEGLLKKINTRIIDKFERSLAAAREHFGGKVSPQMLITREDVMDEREYPIEGDSGKTGFYYTDIVSAMLKKGCYGAREDTEALFLNSSPLARSYKRLPAGEHLPQIRQHADIIGPAHENCARFVPGWAEKGMINAIGFYDPELIKKYRLMHLPGSDFHGGIARKEKIGHDREGNRLQSCLSELRERGFYLLS